MFALVLFRMKALQCFFVRSHLLRQNLWWNTRSFQGDLKLCKSSTNEIENKVCLVEIDRHKNRKKGSSS